MATDDNTIDENSMGPSEEIRKRSITIAGHKTSLSLEEAFWAALKRAAAARHLSINALVEEIDRDRSGNLSSAVRVHLLRLAEGSHLEAGVTDPGLASRDLRSP